MIPWCKVSLVASLMSNHRQDNISVFSPLWSYSYRVSFVSSNPFENLQECNTLVEGSQVVRYWTANVLYPSFPSYQLQVTPMNTCFRRHKLSDHAPSPKHPIPLHRKSCVIPTKSIQLISLMWAKITWGWRRTFLLRQPLAIDQDNRHMLPFAAVWTLCKLQM